MFQVITPPFSQTPRPHAPPQFSPSQFISPWEACSAKLINQILFSRLWLTRRWQTCNRDLLHAEPNGFFLYLFCSKSVWAVIYLFVYTGEAHGKRVMPRKEKHAPTTAQTASPNPRLSGISALFHQDVPFRCCGRLPVAHNIIVCVIKGSSNYSQRQRKAL